MEVRALNDFWTLFSSLAARVGDVEAILAPGRRSLRFAELPRRLEETRAVLNRLGIGRGDRIVVVAPRGPEMAVCFLGVAACATFVPLNPEYTTDEFAHYLDRLHPRAVIVQRGGGGAIRSAAATQGIAVIDLVPVASAPAGTFVLEGPATAAAADAGWATGEDTAVILLTSGTASRQKLVPLKHRGILAFTHAMQQAYALGSTDRCLHVMPMFHGHGLLTSLTPPLAAGGGVICAPTVDVAAIFEHMRTLRPTWYSAGFAFHQAILDQVDGYREIARGANLRFIRSGSGRLETKVIRGLEEAFGAPVLEAYSMSETGTLTYNPLPPRIRKPGTVGVPMFNEVRVIDESGAFIGPNQPGEVVARGPSVFDGYLDDPEANAAAFIDGWFRTGDLGCFDDDGYLTITGRTKEVVNRGGEKIGALEVERALAEHPAVGRVCVFAIPHPSLGEEVAAAVIPGNGGPTSEEAIVAFARERLAPFKVPRRIFFTTAFPTNATGKIDRRALARICVASLSLTAAAADATHGAPSSLESEVAALWRTVLKARAVGVDQDFFLSGGDSLKAAQLFAQVRERFGVALALRQIFDDGATVSGMARLIERARAGASSPVPDGLVPIKTDGDRAPLFAVPGSGGHPVGFVNLGRLLDARQPLYGLESRGLDGARPPLDRMEDIAADNIARIRAMQAQGPYYLTGACFGGRVAYEMACQLDAAGERVALLILLDPSPPFTDERGRPRGGQPAVVALRTWTRLPRFVLGRIQMHIRAVVRLNGDERGAYVREKLGALRGIVAQRDLFRGDRGELHQLAVYEANRAAGRRYVPGPYHGPTVVCLTLGQPVVGQRDGRLDWLGLVPQAGAAQYVPGRDSGDMLNLPHVFALAERVNTWLASEPSLRGVEA